MGFGSKHIIKAFGFLMSESDVVPFNVRERMDGEHTPEMDATRYHQVL